MIVNFFITNNSDKSLKKVNSIGVLDQAIKCLSTKSEINADDLKFFNKNSNFGYYFLRNLDNIYFWIMFASAAIKITDPQSKIKFLCDYLDILNKITVKLNNYKNIIKDDRLFNNYKNQFISFLDKINSNMKFIPNIIKTSINNIDNKDVNLYDADSVFGKFFMNNMDNKYMCILFEHICSIGKNIINPNTFFSDYVINLESKKHDGNIMAKIINNLIDKNIINCRSLHVEYYDFPISYIKYINYAGGNLDNSIEETINFFTKIIKNSLRQSGGNFIYNLFECYYNIFKIAINHSKNEDEIEYIYKNIVEKLLKHNNFSNVNKILLCFFYEINLDIYNNENGLSDNEQSFYNVLFNRKNKRYIMNFLCKDNIYQLLFNEKNSDNFSIILTSIINYYYDTKNNLVIEKNTAFIKEIQDYYLKQNTKNSNNIDLFLKKKNDISIDSNKIEISINSSESSSNSSESSSNSSESSGYSDTFEIITKNQ